MLESLDTLIAFVLIMLVVSMLITICVQMASAALNLRGKYLGQGLAHTFNTILPDLQDHADTIACRILSGRLLSDSKMPIGPNDADKERQARENFKRCATAVRPDEVFDALHRIATGRNPRLDDLKDDASRLLKGLGVSDAVLQRAQAAVATELGKPTPVAIETASEIMGAARQTLAGLPEAQRSAIEAALSPIEKRLTDLEGKAAQEVVDVAGTLDQACQKFKYWFEVSQERAQQWFTTHTRWFTVAFAVIFAFALQLDTVEIFKMVSSNKAVRDKLVAQVSAVTSQAEKIVGDSDKILQDAVNNWRTTHSAEAALPQVASLTVTPADTRGSVRSKLEKALGDNASKDALLQDFDRIVDETARTRLDEGAKDYAALKNSLGGTGFDLFVADPSGRWHHGWFKDLPPHLLGVLFTVGLLSLGAPFWFNVLKSLSNLRSRVAENISSEQERGNANGATPPTVAPAQ
jgi:hypothetical protein